MFPFTVHTLVRNEDRWLWFALNSALPFVSKILVYDTGSTDQTVKIVKSLKSSKVVFSEKGLQDANGMTKLRNEMVEKTKTDWFLLLDGDEVWNQQTIKKFLQFCLAQPKSIQAVFLRTRNCVGDVWHFLPESSGKYEIADRRGNLNIRAFQKGQIWQGTYPLEEYDHINSQPDHLKFFDDYYWHLTHLSRSSQSDKVSGFRRQVIESGIPVAKKELPEVFFLPRPDFVPDPLIRRSPLFETVAKIATPLKTLKRQI